MEKSVSILGCGWLGMPLGYFLAQGERQVYGSTRSAGKMDEISRCGMIPVLMEAAHAGSEHATFFQSDVLIITIPPGNADSEEVYFGQLKNILSLSQNQHLIFISSTSVYPELNRKVSEMDASEKALTRSGMSLLKAESFFQSPENTTVRFAGLVGKNRHPGRWFAGKSGLQGGQTPVNMIHLEDCIGILNTIMEEDLWGKTFNACASEHPTKKEYYTQLALDMGLEPPTYQDDDLTDWKIVDNQFLLGSTAYVFKKSIFDI